MNDDWKPIETAPKDGTVFLGAFPLGTGEYAYHSCWWYDAGEHRPHDSGWETDLGFPGDGNPPTHWKPEPTPPKAKTPDD